MADSSPDSGRTRDLLQRWHGGDQDALGRLVEAHLPHIRAHARRRLGPALREREQTGDIVQDALVAVLRDGPRILISDADHFRALVGRIVENVLRMRHRAAHRERRDVRRERPWSSTVLDLDAGQTSPSQAAARDEDAAWLDLGMELLADDDRQILVLRQWEELPFGDIAVRLGVAEDAARMRFHRALARLGRVLRSLREGQVGEAVTDSDAGPQSGSGP